MSTPTASPAVEVLQRLGVNTGHAAVVGLQWGDEGKGQIVDMLTEHFPVVARFNGGNNAGHSVWVGEEKYALHLLPSGIIRPDTLNVIGNGVVVDPSPETGILKEIRGLRERGVSVTGENLKIADRAHAVFPYHKAEDQLFDVAVAKAFETDAIGTTGRGIGPTYADKAHRSTAVRMIDLVDPDALKAKLPGVVSVKNAMLQAFADNTGHDFKPFDAADLLEQCVAWGQELKPHVTDTRRLLRGLQDEGGQVLFEGANAALLDVDHGTYPFVTSSTTCALGIGPGTGLPPTKLDAVIGVAKAYTSRVGGGPHPTELEDETGEHIREVGREFGTTTGRPRRVGWLDLTAVRYTAQLNGCTGLVVTGLSVLSGLDEVRVCVGYTHRGQALDGFSPDADVLAEAEPVLQSLPGWSGDTGKTRSFDDLPETARAYLAFVEEFVGVPVRIACVGPRRDQALFR